MKALAMHERRGVVEDSHDHQRHDSKNAATARCLGVWSKREGWCLAIWMREDGAVQDWQSSPCSLCCCLTYITARRTIRSSFLARSRLHSVLVVRKMCFGLHALRSPWLSLAAPSEAPSSRCLFSRLDMPRCACCPPLRISTHLAAQKIRRPLPASATPHI